MKRPIGTTIFFLIAGIGVSQASAATLSFVSQCDKIPANGACSADIILESPEGINAIEAEVVIGGTFEATAFNEANSAISYWVEGPEIKRDGGSVSFAGIMPGGFTGKGKILSLTLKANDVGKGSAEFEEAAAYLNDGSGSKAALETRTISFTSIEAVEGLVPPAGEPDLDPPLIFYPEVSRDVNIFSGKWFVVFQTQDKGVGIDHYEVAETETDYAGNSDWETAVSPHRLKDQKLTSYIHIKAVDRVGNRQVTIIPPKEVASPQYDKGGILAVILVIAVALFAVILRRKRAIKRDEIV